MATLLSPDMLSGNLRENDSEKSGIEFSFDAFGYTQQVEVVQESYADGNLAVTAYLSDPTDESFGQPWSSVTVNFGSPLRTPNPMTALPEAPCSKPAIRPVRNNL